MRNQTRGYAAPISAQECSTLAEVIALALIVAGFLLWIPAMIWLFRDLRDEPYG